MSLKDNLFHGVSYAQTIDITDSKVQDRIETMFSRTFLWMGAILALAFGGGFFISIQQIVLPIRTYIGSIIGGFGLVIWMSFRRQAMSYGMLATLLLSFGALEGIALSAVLQAYTNISQVFLTTAVMFAVLAIMGKFININITKRRNILIGGAIALVTMMLISLILPLLTNIEVGSLVTFYSVFGVILFSAFVIYDMNVLKQLALTGENKAELIMALSIFLSFINIFYLLLNLMGSQE